MFLSNPLWVPTGYGQQLKLILPRLMAAGHEIAIQSVYGHQGSPINFNGITIYGSATDPFCQDVMAANASAFNADIIISNMDSWVIDPKLMFNQKWFAWFPVDSDPCPPLVIEKVKQAFHRAVWTEHGKREMDKVKLDYDYIPYGVDLEVFYPGDKIKARETAHMPQDKYIVGMVAMNKGYPSRKAFHQNIEAFKRFHDHHPDTMLYLHTLDGSHPNGESLNLKGFVQQLGLEVGKDVVFADQHPYVMGMYPDSALNTLYNCMDVHLLVSMGEGFGMPQLEAQACGVPVICGDWTSMPELCFSGWKVDKKDAERFYTLQETYQYLPHIDAIAEKLEAAYQMRDNAEYLKRARAGAEKYNINKIVSDYWIPSLEKLEQKIKAAPKQDDLSKNLAVLR